MSIKLGSALQALSAWGPFVPGPRVILRIKDDLAVLSREALGGDWPLFIPQVRSQCS